MSLLAKLQALKRFGFDVFTWETSEGSFGARIEVTFKDEDQNNKEVTERSPTRYGKTEEGALRKCLSGWPLAESSFPHVPIPLETAMILLKDDLDTLTNEIQWLTLELRNAT